jgi:hypothetical protein
MARSFYKPNPYSNGCACTFSFKTKVAKTLAEKQEGKCDKSVFVEFIKQVSWDKVARKPSFKGGLQSNTKLSLTEVADMLRALEDNTHAFLQAKPGPDGKPRYGAFHSSEKGTSQVRFGPFYDKEDPQKQKGFAVSVSRKIEGKEERFSVSFTRAEMKLLERYLKFALDRIFTAQESEDKNLRNEAFKKRESEKDGGARDIL